MRKILFFILLIISFQAFAQPTGYQKRIVNERIQGSFMVDSAFNMPRYYDTTAANLHKRSDSCGAIFFSYAKDSVYYRACNPKRWITIGSGSGGLGALDTLEARGNIWDVVQNSGGTSYKSTRQIVYNVKDYGATGDGVTDDQPFIQRAIDSCHSQGGGVVYFPNGVYLLTATAQSGIHLRIPVSDVQQTDTAASVELRGETPPIMWTLPITAAGVTNHPPNTGVVLKSTILSSTAIIGTNFGSGSSMNFCNLVVRNIGFRVRSKTGVTQVAPEGVGIDGSKLAMLTVDNCRFDTESPRDSTVLPNASCTGIYFPRVNNWVQIYFTNSLITGYYKAVVVAEHFKSNNCELDGNYIGLATWSETQLHPIEIEQMGFWRNAINIQLNGNGRIAITHAVFEDMDTTGSEWFQNIVDLDEPTTGGYRGTIGFEKTISFSGPYDLMTRTKFGGSLVTTYPFISKVETIGYGRGLQKDLDSTSSGLSFMDYTTFNGSFMRIGQIGPTYAGYFDQTANNGVLDATAGDMYLHAGGTKFKFALNTYAQTHEINSGGFKYSSGSYGAFLGSLGGAPFPGVWLGSAADAPDGSNYTAMKSGNLLHLSGGSSGIHFETSQDITNGLLWDANKRLGIGFAYNGTPTASLHIRAGTSSASTAPLKFTTSGAALLATPEAGAMEVLVDSLYWTGNSGTRYKVYPQAGLTPTLQQVTDVGNTTTNSIIVDNANFDAIGGTSFRVKDDNGNVASVLWYNANDYGQLSMKAGTGTLVFIPQTSTSDDDIYFPKTGNANDTLATLHDIRQGASIYTPTGTAVTNVDDVTEYSCQWIRIGNNVTVSGAVNIDPTTAAITTEIRITLPFASNFTASNECGGTFSNGIVHGAVFGGASSNEAHFSFVNNAQTSGTDFFFTFTYRIL